VNELTPKQIVAELDRYIVGQADAKRAVAVAIRNRWRRRRLDDELRKEVSPKNILMIGPTGVGKTEIARRLAKLTGAPFIKVEASKYTEVGYYGRDVESMVRELVDSAINLVRERMRGEVEPEAKRLTDERLLDKLAPTPATIDAAAGLEDAAERQERTREKMRAMLVNGELEDKTVEVVIEKKVQAMMLPGMGGPGGGEMDFDMQGMLEKMLPKQVNRRKLTVKEARGVIFEQECERLIDSEKVNAEAIELAEESGMIFLDEIDKVVASEGGKGADVSRQGVQRDLLPIVEGTSVQTRYGYVRTDHILFVAAGAFHKVSPSDLMPELQGRFPIRVELQPLTKDDFVRILTEPKGALTVQQQALLGVEGLDVVFEPDSIEAMAELAATANAQLENIGARRLMTIVEKVFEQVNFDAPDRVAQGDKDFAVTADFVREQVAAVVADVDLSNFVL